MAGSRVTLKDVARAAEVSPATVSFVLNETPDQTIPEATRERVRRAATELGYVPHGIARALREGSSRIVLLEVGTLPRGHSLDSFIDGLDDELTRHGHTLLVRYGERPEAARRLAIESIGPRAVLDLSRLYDAGTEIDDGGWVDGLAAHTATQLEYLAARGHRAIAIALPAPGPLDALARLRFEYSAQAASVAGLDLATSFTIEGGRHKLRRTLADVLVAHPAVTAVAAFDDDVALQVLAAAADLGLKVPDDLAVIGFDDTDHGALWTPALTSVHIDAGAYGRRAARAALGLDAGESSPARSTVVTRASA